VEKIYLNGTFVGEKEAKVSVFDHGYLYGDGIFETLRAYGGSIFRLPDHLDRLFNSGRGIALSLPWDRKSLTSILMECLDVNGYKDAVLRLSVSRGSGPPALDPDLCGSPTLVVLTRPFAGYPEAKYEKGLRTALVKVRKNLPKALDPQIKSTNFLNNILAKIEAKKAGAEEGILLNHEGVLTEGSVSNLFFLANGRLCTPSLDAGILDGVTRRVILELAQKLGIDSEEGLYSPSTLLGAEEVFMTNTTYEVMPVTKVDNHSFKVGRLSRRLRRAFHECVSAEKKDDADG
jgi:branched-chain amino acid aminotransferase